MITRMQDGLAQRKQSQRISHTYRRDVSFANAARAWNLGAWGGWAEHVLLLTQRRTGVSPIETWTVVRQCAWACP